MDAGSLSSSATTLKSRLRCPLQEQFIQRKSSGENLGRFIPNRSAMDFGYAHYMLTEGAKGKENPDVCPPSRNAYRKQLAEAYNMNRTRILAFKNKPPAPLDLIPHEIKSSILHKIKPPSPGDIFLRLSLRGEEGNRYYIEESKNKRKTMSRLQPW